MISTPIRATDEIVIAYPAGDVWPVLADFAGYGRWWPKSLRVRVLSHAGETLGTEVEIHPVGGRPFRCRVEAVDVPNRIRMRYFGGFVEGVGEWRLEPSDEATRVTYALDVEARGWLVALLGKVLDLGRVHSRHMQSTLNNLATLLDRKSPPAARGR